MFRTILGMLMVFIVFLICWSPLVVGYVIDYYGRWPADAYVTMIGIAWLNSGLNTLLYAWLNSNFREAYKLLLTCKWGQLRNDWINFAGQFSISIVDTKKLSLYLFLNLTAGSVSCILVFNSLFYEPVHYTRPCLYSIHVISLIKPSSFLSAQTSSFIRK